jgi:hypothetical protein
MQRPVALPAFTDKLEVAPAWQSIPAWAIVDGAEWFETGHISVVRLHDLQDQQTGEDASDGNQRIEPDRHNENFHGVLQSQQEMPSRIAARRCQRGCRA